MLKGHQLLSIICNPTPTMLSVLEVYLGWVLEGESRGKLVDAVYLARYFKKGPGYT